MDEICEHMNYKHKPNNYWTKERCQEISSKYNTRIEFKTNDRSVYYTSRKNGWLDEICSHMEIEIKDEFWTKQRCQLEAAKYPKRSHFSYYF